MFSGVASGSGDDNSADTEYVDWEFSAFTGSAISGGGGAGGTPTNPTWNGVAAGNLVGLMDFLISRINQIQTLLNSNPFALIPCDSLAMLALSPETGAGYMYQRVAQVQVSQALINRIDSIKAVAPTAILDGFSVQTLQNASGGTVNCDYFSVHISSLPPGVTPDSLVEYFRKNMNVFTSPNALFSPYTDGSFSDSAKFYSPYEQSVGALIHIQMPDNGTVIESNYYRSFTSDPQKYRFVVSTMTSPLDNNHPVSGNREFGIFGNASTGYTFYTMAVDRTSDWIFTLINQIGVVFRGADSLWILMQKNMTNYINSHSGIATINKPIIARLGPLNNVKNYLLTNKVTYQQLLAILGCLS